MEIVSNKRVSRAMLSTLVGNDVYTMGLVNVEGHSTPADFICFDLVDGNEIIFGWTHFANQGYELVCNMANGDLNDENLRGSIQPIVPGGSENAMCIYKSKTAYFSFEDASGGSYQPDPGNPKANVYIKMKQENEEVYWHAFHPSASPYNQSIFIDFVSRQDDSTCFEITCFEQNEVSIDEGGNEHITLNPSIGNDRYWTANEGMPDKGEFDPDIRTCWDLHSKNASLSFVLENGWVFHNGGIEFISGNKYDVVIPKLEGNILTLSIAYNNIGDRRSVAFPKFVFVAKNPVTKEVRKSKDPTIIIRKR